MSAPNNSSYNLQVALKWQQARIGPLFEPFLDLIGIGR
jgi:hypothetical protein